MATDYPQNLDDFRNPQPNDPVSADHAQQHANANDAIEALEAKVGVDGSEDVNSIDYKLSDITEGDKALPKTNPQIEGGVEVDGDISLTGNIRGEQGNRVLDLTDNENAVNRIEVENSVTGQSPKIEAVGSDTDINIEIIPKGTGQAVVDGKKLPKGNGNSGDVMVSDGAGNFTFQPSITPDNPVFNASKFLFPKSTSPASLELSVDKGTVYFSKTPVFFAGGNSPAFVAPIGDPRIDILALNSEGDLFIIEGTEDPAPVAPEVPLNSIPVCSVYLRVGSSEILDSDDSTNSYILNDLRAFITLETKLESIKGKFIEELYLPVEINVASLASFSESKINGPQLHPFSFVNNENTVLWRAYDASDGDPGVMAHTIDTSTSTFSNYQFLEISSTLHDQYAKIAPTSEFQAFWFGNIGTTMYASNLVYTPGTGITRTGPTPFSNEALGEVLDIFVVSSSEAEVLTFNGTTLRISNFSWNGSTFSFNSRREVTLPTAGNLLMRYVDRNHISFITSGQIQVLDISGATASIVHTLTQEGFDSLFGGRYSSGSNAYGTSTVPDIENTNTIFSRKINSFLVLSASYVVVINYSLVNGFTADIGFYTSPLVKNTWGFHPLSRTQYIRDNTGGTGQGFYNVTKDAGWRNSITDLSESGQLGLLASAEGVFPSSSNLSFLMFEDYPQVSWRPTSLNTIDANANQDLDASYGDGVKYTEGRFWTPNNNLIFKRKSDGNYYISNDKT